MLPATWDKIPAVVSASFAEHGQQLAALIREHLGQLKSRSFQQLQQEYTHPATGEVMSMFDARNKPADCDQDDSAPWRMTEARLLALPSPRAADIRAFLYHALNLNNLFSGDGYTHTADGMRGYKEYVAPNKKLEDLNVAWAICPIGLPTVDACMERVCNTYEVPSFSCGCWLSSFPVTVVRHFSSASSPSLVIVFSLSSCGAPRSFDIYFVVFFLGACHKEEVL